MKLLIIEIYILQVFAKSTGFWGFGVVAVVGCGAVVVGGGGDDGGGGRGGGNGG